MREIKFRGKRLDYEEWLLGNIQVPIPSFDKYFMWHSDGWQHEVIPESVGQYTGLKDKNGKEIYEGDVIDTHYNMRYVCEFRENGCFEFINEFGNHSLFVEMYSPEIIGNIHDNPELLKP